MGYWRVWVSSVADVRRTITPLCRQTKSTTPKRTGNLRTSNFVASGGHDVKRVRETSTLPIHSNRNLSFYCHNLVPRLVCTYGRVRVFKDEKVCTTHFNGGGARNLRDFYIVSKRSLSHCLQRFRETRRFIIKKKLPFLYTKRDNAARSSDV